VNHTDSLVKAAEVPSYILISGSSTEITLILIDTSSLVRTVNRGYILLDERCRSRLKLGSATCWYTDFWQISSNMVTLAEMLITREARVIWRVKMNALTNSFNLNLLPIRINQIYDLGMKQEYNEPHPKIHQSVVFPYLIYGELFQV